MTAAQKTGQAWAVILAAGDARRFGSNKLQASLWGRPLLAHVLEAVTAARRTGDLAGAILVLAQDDDASARTAAPSGALTVVNTAPDGGLGGSLRLGFERLAQVDPPAAAALIVLADQPLLDPATVAALVAAWRDGAEVARPVYAEEPDIPGHPVLLDRSRWSLLEEAGDGEGLARTLAGMADDVTLVAVPGRNPDVDTPDDLARLEDAQ